MRFETSSLDVAPRSLRMDPSARIFLDSARDTDHIVGGLRDEICESPLTEVGRFGYHNGLKAALLNLQGKLDEGRAKSELLLAKHRRARATKKAADAHSNFDAQSGSSAWDRMSHKINRAEAVGQAHTELLDEGTGSVEDRFAALEKQDEVERLLADFKKRR